MAELSLEDKAKRAAGLLVQSPPGEINDVINDLRSVIGDDTALMAHVRPALRNYNLAQLHVVEHQSSGAVPAHSSILSESAIATSSGETERYVDFDGKRSFAFDHITLAVSEYEAYELPEEEETFRSELAKSLSAYTKNHFPSGTSSVSCSQFPLLPPAPPTAIPDKESAQSSGNDALGEEKVEQAEEGEAPIESKVIEKSILTPTGVDIDGPTEKEVEQEPVPTPVGGGETKQEEVVEEGGIEKVDAELEEVKEKGEEPAAATTNDAAEVEVIPSTAVQPTQSDSAVVEEPVEPVGESADPTSVPEVSKADSEVPVDAAEPKSIEQVAAPQAAETAAIPAAEERKQERTENPLYTLEIVGNRYKPNNFWTGRWRTRWVVDQAAGQVTGTINIDVHYYEQGNVQLSTSHNASFPCPSTPNGTQSIASQIVTTISKIETNYHLEMNDVYEELGEKAFRALRRALPVTRQKMDWEKVQGYNLGSDLTKSRA